MQGDLEVSSVSHKDTEIRGAAQASTSRQEDGAESRNESDGEGPGEEPLQIKLHEDLPPAVVALVASRDG